jgi:hypothetical protein
VRKAINVSVSLRAGQPILVRADRDHDFRPWSIGDMTDQCTDVRFERESRPRLHRLGTSANDPQQTSHIDGPVNH